MLVDICAHVGRSIGPAWANPLLCTICKTAESKAATTPAAINALNSPELPRRTPRRASCGWTGRARAPEGAQDARTLPAAAPGAHAKYDLGVCAVPDKLGHMYEMPDPVLLWQSVLAFAERGPEHRDPQF